MVTVNGTVNSAVNGAVNGTVNSTVNERDDYDPFADLQYLADYLDTTPDTPEREKIRLIAIGTPAGVNDIIQTLHRLYFANISDWSPLLPIPNSIAVMSILTRYRVRG